MSFEAKFRRKLEGALMPHVSLMSYMSSMSKSGIPDEHLIHDGRAYWLELKAVEKWPKKNASNVLKHRFTAPQLAFMRRTDEAKGRGFGVIGWNDGLWRCIAVRVHRIADDGSISKEEIDKHAVLTLDPWFHARFLNLIHRS